MMGDSMINSFLPCGKELSKASRDSKKYLQMHKKVCATCRDALTIDTHAYAAGTGVGINGNGHVEHRNGQGAAMDQVRVMMR